MTDATPPLSPRKTPRQARSKATVHAILEAAARILETQGVDAVTTNAVADRAGVSVGSLYQYFPSKEAIFAELIRQMRSEMRDDIFRAIDFVADKSLEFAMARLVRAVIHHHVHRALRADALEHLEAQLPPDPDSMAMARQTRTRLALFLAQHDVPTPDQAAGDILHLIIGIAHPALHGGETNFDALARRIDPAVLGYLGANVTYS
ncbi:helix-turn-helix domain-containing protein [Celeribacter baekdonensis]|uniref:TetR/AcrR family transcriptional regulator n=1 Tax=Celeribacter baekdonensis TaxID=875171 RepID=UPI0030D6E398|tara:strand:+ start:200319 stop:200936 length:618 start_codon:yes stop_codon:yes gene_type:complete